MPIEFRCRQCGKLLRTNDDTAGRQAQCPGCGAIGTVPSSTAPSQPPSPPLPLPDLGYELAAGPTIPRPDAPENPYRSPATPTFKPRPGESKFLAQQRVAGPATALMVTAILGILANLAVALLYGIVLAVSVNGHIREIDRHQDPAQLALGSGILVAAGVFGVVVGVLALFGAIRMKKLESYVLSIVTTILVMIPCISPCSLLGLPFGIWALVVLSDQSVKSAFRS
jgi:hypothetical protein